MPPRSLPVVGLRVGSRDLLGHFRPERLPRSPLTNDTVSILRGNGDGTFQAREAFVVGAFPAGLAVDDCNRDGRTWR
jgi:hypothetical protein